MSVIVTDAGFAPGTEVQAVTLADIAHHSGSLDLAHTDGLSVSGWADLDPSRLSFLQ
jgi:hypothetical protein